MKNNFLFFSILIISTITFAQQIEYNTQNEYIAGGYDVVSYFNNKVIKGENQFITIYDGAKLKFSSQENLNLFKANTQKYFPQYGGWCAYAMGISGEKVDINPKTFEIRDGKLYLFYNKFFTNTLDYWKKENPEKLKEKAEKNWTEVKFKKD